MKIELPIALKDWLVKPVGKLFDINPEALSNSTSADLRFRYIPLESVHPERIDFASVHQIQFGEAPSRARRVIKRGDLLISTVRPNLQGFAEFQPPDEDLYICSTGFAVLRPKNGHDQQFYLQQLLSDFGASQFHAHVTGTNYPAISDRDFAHLKLLVPEENLEKEAAATLRIISAAIATGGESITNAARLQLGLMQQLLSGKLRPDGGRRRKTDFYEGAKFGLVPKGWTECRVRDIAAKVTDGDHITPRRVSAGFYLLSARNIANGRLLLNDVDYVDEEELFRIRKRCDPDADDLLISCSGTIGNACLVPQGMQCTLVRSAALVKFQRKRCDPKFMEWLFRATPMQRQMKVAASVSIQGNIFQGAIRRLWLCLPGDVTEQEEIAQRLTSIEALILAKEQKNAALQRLKKSLMQNLLTGRIRLPVAKEGKEKP